MRLIIGLIFIALGVSVGIVEHEYGAMFMGIVIGSYCLIRYAINKNKIDDVVSDEQYMESDQGYQSSSHSTSSGIGKVGYRTPSLSKSISASTTGKLKRQVKSAVDPTYNVKGVGYIKNPKRAIKNKLYKKKTKSLF